ncbi:MAG: hypothetical protein DHS20C16_06640 [Phycisphaerae bacterium]|nr:MAG: hypothetical protein DHS20C16_06640 [Phycisphaerae bacterium]
MESALPLGNNVCMKQRSRKRRILAWLANVVCFGFVALWIDRILSPTGLIPVLMQADYLAIKTIIAMLLLMFIPVALSAYWFWRMDNQPEGRCLDCGYNLTGNVSGVCPECGTPIK